MPHPESNGPSSTAKLTVYTPDCGYDDGGAIEREIIGDRVDFHADVWKDQAGLNTELLRRADGLLVWHQVALDAPTIGRLEKCRVIVRAGVGFNNIDIAAAGARGIPVCNTPDYGTAEVADHALALLLALERGLIPFERAMQADPVAGFDYRIYTDGRRLAGRTFAIVGLGRIGTAAALRAKAFGLRVVAFDPLVPRGQEIALGVERVDTLEALLARADILSLHLPLSAATTNLIDAAALRKLKAGATILNTARGGLIDLEALFAAMQSGHVRSAGIDVFPVEPPQPVPRILRAHAAREPWLEGRLVVSPHAAWSSIESRRDARTKSTETILAYLLQGELRNCVNADLLAPSRSSTK
jgi:phosphoglycerate dehydrogenase-like enzyme